MQTSTLKDSPFPIQRYKKFSKRSISYSFRLFFCLLLFNNVFNAVSQAQQCPYNISLVSRTYNASANQTIFVWNVVNPNPGNGDNGTVQDLSHWGFMANTCPNPADALKDADIVSAGTGSGPNSADHSSIKVEIKRDPSQICAGNTPVLKFDRGTNGSTPKYYSLVLSGNWGPGDLHAYYKSGSRTSCGLCTITGAGVGCRIAQQNICNFPIPLISTNPICLGTPTGIITVTNPQSGVTYSLFRDGIAIGISITYVSGPLSFTELTAGNYIVRATVNGCPSQTSAILGLTNIDLPTPTFDTIGTLCPGATATLSATFPSGTTVTGVSWSGTGVSGNTFTAPSIVGIYTVNYSASVNGCVAGGSFIVNVAAAPAPVITAIGPLCAGEKALLVATFPSGSSVSNIAWSGTGVSGDVFTAPMISSQTTYMVNFSATVNGCAVTGSTTIVVRPIPNPLYLAVYDYCPGETGGRIEVRNIEAGVSYQVRIVGGAAIGPVLTGAAGTNLTFTNIPAGYYQILATNLTTGCVNAFGGATVAQVPVTPCLITGSAGRIALSVTGLLTNSNRLQVVAYPNPFSDQIKFSITSPQSGKGTLQLYDLKGSLIKTIDVGMINAGQTITLDYAVPGPNRVSMTYKLNVGRQETTGKLINIK